MGEIRQFNKEKLIFGVLFVEHSDLDVLRNRLEAEYGSIDLESRIFDFNYTNYYNPEMGNKIKRLFVSFKELVAPEDLAAIKINSNKIEQKFTKNNARLINLDPGILNLSRLILASTKNNAHRVPLSKGIYGELTLLYTKKIRGFTALPWTYPDFGSGDYSNDFFAFRQKYAEQMKQQ